MILKRMLLAKGILQVGPLGINNVGWPRWYHNPQVPRLQWRWDPGGSIDGKIVWDVAIKGFIHVHLVGKHRVA